jgi:hypothetical protein
MALQPAVALKHEYFARSTESHSRSVGVDATRGLGHGYDPHRRYDDRGRANGLLLRGTGAFQRNDGHDAVPKLREKARIGKRSQGRN